MQISFEGKLGIGLTLLFGVGTGAVTVLPDQAKFIGWITIALSLLGLIVLLYHSICEWLKLSWRSGYRSKMIALAGMIFSGVCFIGFTATYCWPQKERLQEPTKSSSQNSTDMDFAISLKCTSSAAPKWARRDARLYIFQIIDPPDKNAFPVNFSVAGTFMAAGDYALNMDDNYFDAQICTISNYGPHTIAKMRLEFQVMWLEVVPHEHGSGAGHTMAQATITHSDFQFGPPPAQSDYFYFINQSQKYVRILLPSRAQIMLAGSEEYKTVNLVPYSTILDNNAMFSPRRPPQNPTNPPNPPQAAPAPPSSPGKK